MLPSVFRLLYFCSNSRVRSNSCISWRISFKFCMEYYLGKIYTPIVFSDAAPSVPSFIGSKVICWWKSCVRSAGHISWRISFIFFFTDVHHSQIYRPIVFGEAAPSVPSFIGSKVIFWWKLVCALTAAFLDGFLSYFVWRCILVKSTRLMFWWCCPQCSVFYRVKGHILV